MEWVTGIFIPLFASVVGALLGGVGTYFGVKWTVRAENEREHKNKIELKNNLVLGMLRETDMLREFLQNTHSLNNRQGDNLAIESRMIEDTVADQLKLFDNPELIRSLSDLRQHVQLVRQALDVIRGINSDSISPRPYQIVTSNWGTYKDWIIGENGDLKRVVPLLKAEYQGELPKV